MRRLVLLSAPLLLGACSLGTVVDDQGRVVQRSFGYVEIVLPPRLDRDETLRVEGARAYGVTVREGVTIGFSQSSRVLVPLDCRAVIIVQTQDQLDQVAKLFQSIGGGDRLCGTVTPE